MRGQPIAFSLLLVLLTGCGTPSVLERPRPYRDPLSYTFDRKSSGSEKDPILQIFSSFEDSGRQIQEWEKKHLW